MKYSSFIAIGAGLILAACSNEEGATLTETVNDGYMALTVTLPTETMTKSVDFESGDADEYAVLNGRIVVFRNAASESEATFVCTAELSGMSWSAAQQGEITTTASSTARLTNINMSDANAQYSAVVVLNYNDSFVFPAAGQTFGEWSATAQANSMMVTDGGKNYLTMTQAPRYASSSTNPITLVQIDKSKIAQSESAISDKGAEFYVQRALAKVTVTAGDYDVTGANYSGDKVSINAWALDVTNKKTFPLQVTNGLLSSYSEIWTKARFSGAENAKFRRIFWTLDPNYNKDFTSMDAVKTEFNIIGNSDLTSKTDKLYCLENTFDINHQLQGQTTRVVMKGSYTPNSIQGYQQGESFFRLGSATALWLKSTLEEEIKSKAVTVLNSTDVVVSLDKVAESAGNYSLNDVSIKVSGNDIDSDTRLKVAKALGLKSANDKGIATYFKGECYYVARVKHFGDEETPWSIGDETYGGNNERWLGRYGVVRNTIYSITVNSVSNPGSPTVPEIDPTEPDDVNDYYIDINVNILPWAKRVNNTDL